jgi:hypothetical protein
MSNFNGLSMRILGPVDGGRPAACIVAAPIVYGTNA